MENQKKILTRVQLINWHFFENERISMQGSTLISGENTAGKSTILDAIQLVLTTNTRKFNVAANEKGNRDLRGYVRCKIGNVGETYFRKNTVPANVALEFYEEKGDRYFVIGVHMLSADEESPIITRWYMEECRLEALSFIVDNRPALSDEFRINGQKIRFIDHKNAAQDRFKRRLGNLDNKFFDIIPKSLAFKPMDNVKDFINKFVLSEEHVDVASLRENIETLSELEGVLERSRRQLGALETILEKYDAIRAKERDIKVNELLLAFASHEALGQEIETIEKDIRLKKQAMESNQNEIGECEKRLKDIDSQLLAIQLSMKENESSKLVEETKKRIENLEIEIAQTDNNKRLLVQQIQNIKQYLRALLSLEQKPLTLPELMSLGEVTEEKKKVVLVDRLESFNQNELEMLRDEQSRYKTEIENLTNAIEELQKKQRSLEQQELVYPSYATELKCIIEKEFGRRGIRSNVYILSELLEITDIKWTNAVEGYFHTQKFYLVVEPEYYDIALSIYDKNKNRLHTAGILNTKKIPLDTEVNSQSLAYVVRSENRYAKAYANYILGRVVRCENVSELEQYSIAITPDCMLYQGYVVRHLNPKDYENPYIGQNAYRTQLVNVKKELEEKSKSRKERREQIQQFADVFESLKKVNTGLVKIYMNAPNKLESLQEQWREAKSELKEAQKDPGLIALNAKLDETLTRKGEVEGKNKTLNKENIRLDGQIEAAEKNVSEKRIRQREGVAYLEEQFDKDGVSYQEAEEKYRQNRKSKSAQTIADNFAPQRTQFQNEREALLNARETGLIALQYRYNQDFALDYRVGPEGMSEYREARQKLKSVEMVRYEEQLKKAKDDCEAIFKSEFLSKMKEHIEAARNEFRNLNNALNNIYYGEDSYRFKISYDKKKEGLYRMITSENNQEGYNLWTSAFETEYKEEMSELFDKLMTKDDNGQKIVEEYTDYRSYLDYDIEIHKRDGSVQRFSDIYGEKSGSETQVPYYVAIAASFYQLYRYGNSVRLMLLDEAFDKMDDERILSMMDFFNGLGLQTIIATPPAKIEIIGEKVDTILTAIRIGQSSIVEEYDL